MLAQRLAIMEQRMHQAEHAERDMDRQILEETARLRTPIGVRDRD